MALKKLAFDPAIEFIKYKNAYARERGTVAVKTAAGITPKRYPATTWGDVIAFYSAFLAYADPTDAECMAIMQKKGFNRTQAGHNCLSNDPAINPRAFVHTSQYNVAKRAWEMVSPYWIAAKQAGVNPDTPAGRATGITLAITKVPSLELYPYNKQFWEYGEDYAKWRGATTAVPYKMDLAIEAIKETAADLYQKMPKIPDPTPWVELIKWASIGTGVLFLGYFLLKGQRR